jgi:hypothetical protein
MPDPEAPGWENTGVEDQRDLIMDERLDMLGRSQGLNDPSDLHADGSAGGTLVDFLYPAPAPRTGLGIVKWWESRRLKYNAIVGGAGLVSLGAFHLLMSLPPDPFHLAFTPLPILMFGLLANVCYLLGPSVELAIEKLGRGKILPTGPALFRMGLTFSVGLTLLPTLLGGMNWIYRLLAWIF